MNIEHPASELGAELVFGDEPIDDEHLEALRREIAQLRADYAAAPAPEPRDDLARLFEPEPQNAPAAVVPLRSGTSAGRRPVRLTRRLAIAAAAVVGAAALTTGLAAADVLPGPVQQAVHDVLSHAGVHVPPSGTDDHRVPPPTVPSTVEAGTAPTGAAPSGAPGTASGSAPAPSDSPSAPSASVPPVPGLPGVPGVPGLPPVTVPPVTLPPVTVPSVIGPGAGALLPPLGGLPLLPPPTLAPPSTSPSSGHTSSTTSPTTVPRLPLPPLPPLTLPRLPPLLP